MNKQYLLFMPYLDEGVGVPIAYSAWKNKLLEKVNERYIQILNENRPRTNYKDSDLLKLIELAPTEESIKDLAWAIKSEFRTKEHYQRIISEQQTRNKVFDDLISEIETAKLTEDFLEEISEEIDSYENASFRIVQIEQI